MALEKAREFRSTKYAPEDILRALDVFEHEVVEEERANLRKTFSIERDVEAWGLDDIQDFLSEYRADFLVANLHYFCVALGQDASFSLEVSFKSPPQRTAVQLQSASITRFCEQLLRRRATPPR